MQRPCPYCAEDIKAAAIVCRYCGRDVIPLNASRVPAFAGVEAPSKTPETSSPEVDAFAAEIARVAKISVLTDRAKAGAAPAPPRKARWARRLLPRSIPLRLAAVVTLLPFAVAAIFAAPRPNVDLWDPISPPRKSKPGTAATSPTAYTPLPVALAPTRTPSFAPVAAPVVPARLPEPEEPFQPDGPEDGPYDDADYHLTPDEKQAVADYAALTDDTLKTVVRMEGIYGQARACNIRSPRIEKAAKANSALLNQLARGEAGVIGLGRRFARIGVDAQRAGKAGGCGGVREAIYAVEGLYRERGVIN